jgi:hypothetical protein
MSLHTKTGVFARAVGATRHRKAPVRHLPAVGPLHQRMAQLVKDQLTKRIVDVKDARRADEDSASAVAGGVTVVGTLDVEAESPRGTDPEIVDGCGVKGAWPIAGHRYLGPQGCAMAPANANGRFGRTAWCILLCIY